MLKKIVLLSSLAAVSLLAKTELVMYYPVAVGGPLTKIVDKMTEDFTKENPDISVKAVYAGNYSDTRVKALAAINAKEKVQFAVLADMDTYDLIEQGVVEPISDIAKSDEDKKWLDSFYPNLMLNNKTLGKTWGVPFQRSTIVMYYNKEMFKKAGLDPEKAPASWDELVSMGKKLTNAEHSAIIISNTGYPYWMYGAFIKQSGGKMMSEDGKKVFFDAPQSVEALQFWSDLANKHEIMPKGIIEWGTLRQNFLEGKTAMMWHTTGNLTEVKNNAKFDFGVAVLPKNKEWGSPTGGGNLYVFKHATAEEKAAALKFIKFVTTPKMQAKWSIETGYVGTSAAAYETPELKEYAKGFPQALVARDQLQNATTEFAAYQGARLRKIIDDSIQAVLTGKKEAAVALKEAQSQADRILKPYNK